MPRLGMLEYFIHMDLENHIPVQVKPRLEKCPNDCPTTSEKVRQLIAKFPSSKPMTNDLSSLGYYNANSCRKCLTTSLHCDSHPIPLFPANLETDANNGSLGKDPVRIQPLYHNDKKPSLRTASLIGDAAKNQLTTNPENTVFDAKRLSRREWSDAIVQHDVKFFPFKSRAWRAVTEVMQLLQMVVTATAFALYYIIYGWVQVVYHGLRIAMYFKDSDGPMKITIGIVAVTSIVVGFNMLLRIRKIYSDILR